MANLKYKRMLLKISGEGFCDTNGFGLEGPALENVARQIGELCRMGVQPAVVVGAGNYVRGATLSQQCGVHRVTADQIGMLATIINSIALQDILEAQGCQTRVLSAIEVRAICEPFIRRRAINHLEKKRVVILAGGTGNPFFTTDTCAALRASEIQADVLIKATKVDGIYSADPKKQSQATLFDKLSYNDVLDKNLKIMDHAAVSLCQKNQIDIIVCNLFKQGAVAKVAQGEKIGTLVSNG
ncbi:UMP kinase [Planctomycetota bacterium]